jgi:hypothetical protein
MVNKDLRVAKVVNIFAIPVILIYNLATGCNALIERQLRRSVGAVGRSLVNKSMMNSELSMVKGERF